MVKLLSRAAAALLLCGGVLVQDQVRASSEASAKVGTAGITAQSQASASASSDAKVQAEKDSKGARVNTSGQSSSKAQAGHASVGLASGDAVEAVLTKPVDSSKAKPGDPVEARVAKDVKSESDGKVILPKGTKLLGHVTEAKPRVKGEKGAKGEARGASDSRLGIDFDKAILKGGREVPLNVAIQAVAAAESMTHASAGDELMASGSGAGSAASGGGGLVGGVTSTVGATAGAATNAVGGVGQTVGGAVGSATSATGNAGGSGLAGALTSNSSGVIGMQGLNLIQEAAGSAQGSVITSGERNVKLDSGTRLLLKVVQQEPATPPAK